MLAYRIYHLLEIFLNQKNELYIHYPFYIFYIIIVFETKRSNHNNVRKRRCCVMRTCRSRLLSKIKYGGVEKSVTAQKMQNQLHDMMNANKHMIVILKFIQIILNH